MKRTMYDEAKALCEPCEFNGLKNPAVLVRHDMGDTPVCKWHDQYDTLWGYPPQQDGLKNASPPPLLDRLRVLAAVAPGGFVEWAIAAEAADEIERLREIIQDILNDASDIDHPYYESRVDWRE